MFVSLPCTNSFAVTSTRASQVLRISSKHSGTRVWCSNVLFTARLQKVIGKADMLAEKGLPETRMPTRAAKAAKRKLRRE